MAAPRCGCSDQPRTCTVAPNLSYLVDAAPASAGTPSATQWRYVSGDRRMSDVGDGERHGLASEHSVHGVGQLEEDAVLPGGESDEDHRFAARVDEVPARVVDRDVDMTDARGHRERALAKHRQDAQMLGPVLDEDATLGERLGKRRIDDESRRRFIFDRDER